MKNEVRWFRYDESKKLEEQVKYNIAMACEGLLNSYYDGYAEEVHTKDWWINYIYSTMQECFETAWGSEYGKDAAKHLHFYGKEKTINLIEYYLDNYDDVKEYIKG